MALPLAALAWCWLLGACVFGAVCWRFRPRGAPHWPTEAAVAAAVILWPLSLPILILALIITAWRHL